MADVVAAKRALATADAVSLDVDSTVSPDEGIDVLAAVAGVADQVAALTRAAMGGAVKFEDALAQRLAIIRPTPDLIAKCLAAHPPRLTPGCAEFVAACRKNGKAVHLVSGGFAPFVLPLAKQLGLPDDSVTANRFTFASTGPGFDLAVPTAKSGGKARALIALQERHGYRRMVMIGDGATDMEAKPPAKVCIGFGGVMVRAPVKARADWFVTSFAPLTAVVTRPWWR
jgi:phosphoserine phosphatase